ncbi:phosphatase PAP2 family protein [Bacillus sp. JJ1127]|uniref:phosphatase PAP2 family protein n=1 Tax=Bacillus sp. JJ1127 TaxID=3122952 RepID=UPI002FFF3C7D
MNLKLQFTRAFFLSLASIMGFALIAILIGEQKITKFDNVVISFIQGFESPTMTKIMKFFTTIGSTSVVIVISVLTLFFLYKVLHHRTELILFVTVIMGTAVFNQVLKFMFKRARPTLHRLIEENGYSFPSGHSMEAFALYGVLTFLLWRHITTRIGRIFLILISVIMTVAIGVSRIYLGVHYPSDVLGGYLASCFWLTVTIWIFQHYVENRKQQAKML